MTAELVALPETEMSDQTRRFLKWTREIATTYSPNMTAFVVVAWDKGGCVSIVGDLKSDDNPIPVYLLPAWIAEHVRAEFVTHSEVKGILRNIGVLEPLPPEGA